MYFHREASSSRVQIEEFEQNCELFARNVFLSMGSRPIPGPSRSAPCPRHLSSLKHHCGPVHRMSRSKMLIALSDPSAVLDGIHNALTTEILRFSRWVAQLHAISASVTYIFAAMMGLCSGKSSRKLVKRLPISNWCGAGRNALSRWYLCRRRFS